jgi:glycosyltransferase involved in cell wall biosynthesis
VKKIIHILAHQPPYHYFRENKPPIHFDLPDHSYVGIWEYDIPNLFAYEIIKYTSEFKIEVWQPDYRADREYSHEFSCGVVKRQIRGRFGMKKIWINDPTFIFNKIESEIKNHSIVLHLHGLGYNLNEGIIERYPHIPKVINFHSRMTALPEENWRKWRKNIFANAIYFRRHRNLLGNSRIIFTYNNSYHSEKLKRYNPLKIKRIFTGVDFDFFIPASDREGLRSELNIRPNEKLFFMGSRFEPVKQIDKFIKIFKNISDGQRRDIILCIAGHGSKEYEGYLKNISEPLLSQGRIRFPGYLYAHDLRRYYQAADLFISCSLSEGGPTSVVKAIACETPVFCTRVNGVDDILDEYDAGIRVRPNDFNDWSQKLVGVAISEKIKLLDRETAKEYWNWPIVARKYIDIYHILFS